MSREFGKIGFTPRGNRVLFPRMPQKLVKRKEEVEKGSLRRRHQFWILHSKHRMLKELKILPHKTRIGKRRSRQDFTNTPQFPLNVFHIDHFLYQDTNHRITAVEYRALSLTPSLSQARKSTEDHRYRPFCASSNACSLNSRFVSKRARNRTTRGETDFFRAVSAIEKRGKCGRNAAGDLFLVNGGKSGKGRNLFLLAEKSVKRKWMNGMF